MSQQSPPPNTPTSTSTSSFRDVNENVYLLFINNTFTSSIKTITKTEIGQNIYKTVHQAIVIIFYASSSNVEVRKFEVWERDSSISSNDDIRNAIRIFQRCAAENKCLFYDCKRHSGQPWRLKVKETNQYCTTGQINWPAGLVAEERTKSKHIKHVCRNNHHILQRSLFSYHYFL